ARLYIQDIRVKHARLGVDDVFGGPACCREQRERTGENYPCFESHAFGLRLVLVVWSGWHGAVLVESAPAAVAPAVQDNWNCVLLAKIRGNRPQPRPYPLTRRR